MGRGDGGVSAVHAGVEEMTASYNLVTQTVSLTWTPEEAAQVSELIRKRIRGRIRSAFWLLGPVRRVKDRTIVRRRPTPDPMVFRDKESHANRTSDR